MSAAPRPWSWDLAGDRLRHVSDTLPGITRVRARGGFRYRAPDGSAVRDEATLARIKALAIPPAYEQVWICPHACGHLQATGRDARGRKQYRYHPAWDDVRKRDKFHQLIEFGHALPRIRRRVREDLKRPGLDGRKVAALVLRLLETTLVRVGTPEYARTNKSYGLTTLTRRHARISASQVRFRFRGKSGILHDVTVSDRRIARIVKRCMELPGQELFQYTDDAGQAHVIDSGRVNAYLKEAGGGDFTAKDYRTWAGSVQAFSLLQRRGKTQQAPARQAVVEAVKEVSQLLNNTPAVCRACYIHPAVEQAYLDGGLPPRRPCAGPDGLRADERRFLGFLQAWRD